METARIVKTEQLVPAQNPTTFFNRQALNELSAQDKVLFEFFGRGPEVAPSHELIHEAFRDQAKKVPDHIAVECEGRSMTYRELDEASDLVGAKLIAMGVLPGDHVGLFLKRSIEMVVGILGILKVGAAYVPQDARISPTKQLRHVVDAAGINVVLTLSDLVHLIPQSNEMALLSLDSFYNASKNLMVKPMLPKISVSSTATCFVLFTSGTTGNPNGVQVMHKNLANILLTTPGDMGMKPGLRVSQILNIAFDMAAWETLGAITHGATLVIRGKDIEETVKTVDIVIATPSILSSIDASKCQRVGRVAVAGEPCPEPLAQKWSAFADFYNSCGPTEVTIVNTMGLYNGEVLTIGAPTPNNTVYILGENLEPLAVGEIGEMWAGGDCVSAGYIANDKLNAERYRLDPFLGEGRMMFRTRDLGRWNEFGELEYHGRTDDQVKVRGFRVELDSVSKAIESIEGCSQAVTLKLDSRNLVSFVTPKSVDLKAAKEAVENRFPYYCTPSMLIALDELPRTDRGKIDKRLLLSMIANPEAQTELKEIEVIL